MCGTRPDIAYVIGVVPSRLDNPTKCDIIKVERIFINPRDTSNCELVYKLIIYKNNVNNVLDCHSDADHASDPDRHMTFNFRCALSLF